MLSIHRGPSPAPDDRGFPTRPITHLRRPLLVASVVVALVTISCSASSTSDSAGRGEPAVSGQASATTSAQQPGVERLRIALPQDRGPLNLFAGAPDPLIELVYDKLFAPSPYAAEPQPWLAEGFRVLDPQTWEVTLRDGVRWHDGQPLTAADVAFTFEFFLASPTGRYTHHVSEVPHIEEVEAVDEATVRFRCAYPCPDLAPITLADLPIIPSHVWSGVTEPRTVTDLPVGTGPYQLVDYSATGGYRFEANDAYFAGRPVVEELVMPVIPDPTTTFTALRTGEIDAAFRPLPPELVGEFEGEAGIGLLTPSPLEFPELRLNFERPPFDRPEVRRALSLAVDREEILEVVYLGQGRVADRGYPHPDSPWTNPSLRTPLDRDQSRSLLDGAGFVDRNGDGVREGSDGRPFAFTIKVSGSEPVEGRAAELLVEQLAEVGVAATVERVDAGAITSLFRSRDFDAYINVIGPHGVADPTQFIMSHRSGYLWRAGTPYPEWDELFERWKATDTVADRTTVLFEMQELFNRQPTSVPLVYPEERFAFRTAAYGGWVEARGFGLVHKWSFLPDDVRRAAGAVVDR